MTDEQFEKDRRLAMIRARMLRDELEFSLHRFIGIYEDIELGAENDNETFCELVSREKHNLLERIFNC